jgi:hypothetical protein
LHGGEFLPERGEDLLHQIGIPIARGSLNCTAEFAQRERPDGSRR